MAYLSPTQMLLAFLATITNFSSFKYNTEYILYIGVSKTKNGPKVYMGHFIKKLILLVHWFPYKWAPPSLAYCIAFFARRNDIYNEICVQVQSGEPVHYIKDLPSPLCQSSWPKITRLFYPYSWLEHAWYTEWLSLSDISLMVGYAKFIMFEY